MILIGSYALALNGHRSLDKVKDIDLVGTEDDVERFRKMHAAIIKKETLAHGHVYLFQLEPGQPVAKVEIDVENTESNGMLPALCREKATIMGFEVAVAPLEVLYILKRSHLNVPVFYEKGVRDMLELKPSIKEFSPGEEAFYRTRKQEIIERFALHRQRFTLSIRNEDFFDLSDHIRFYVHDDLHEAVAHTPGQPLYKKCKHDLSLAKIDIDLFEELAHADQLRMVQEEFMVIGLERYFLHNRALNTAEVYEMGMHKTIRDLFTGYFQDFCIDHLDELMTPPPYDFVARFCDAESKGQLRQVEIPIPPPTAAHKEIWTLLQKGELEEARRRSEDMLRQADRGIDTHATFLLGVALFRMKKLKLAERCLRMCLSRDRKHPMAWFFLGTLLRMTERNPAAIKALTQAAKLGFRTFGLHWNLGLAFEKQNMPRRAIAAYKRAQAQKQDDPRPSRRLAALEASLAAA